MANKIDLGFDSNTAHDTTVTHLLDKGRYLFEIGTISFNSPKTAGRPGSLMLRAKVVGSMNGKFIGCKPQTIFINLPDVSNPNKDPEVVERIEGDKARLKGLMAATGHPQGTGMDLDFFTGKVVMVDVGLIAAKIGQDGKEWPAKNAINRFMPTTEWQGSTVQPAASAAPTQAASNLPAAEPVASDEQLED